jgi:hypothetical protein
VRLDEWKIRWLGEPEAWVKRRESSQRDSDERYWNQMVVERGGQPTEHMEFDMRVKRSYPSGMSGVELRPCLVSTKRA